MRCVPPFNSTDVHRRRWDWGWDGGLRWLGAVFIIHSDYGHRCQYIEGIGRQIEVVETWRNNRLLIAKPIGHCGVNRVRVQRHNSWFRGGDRGDCDDLYFHSFGYLRRIEDRRGNISDWASFCWCLLHVKNIRLWSRNPEIYSWWWFV